MTFQHKQSAHCESGVISSMLTHSGLTMSEPMAFGLSSSLAFAYIPFVKLAGMPLIAYRMPPKHIIKGLQKNIGFSLKVKKFRSPETAQKELDNALGQNKLVGLQTSVFWLPYFPEDMRFHFNAHNLMVTHKNADGTYGISDPVFEEPVTITPEDLTKARFAKGPLAAKGLMYYIEGDIPEVDYQKIIPKAIKKNIRTMTGAPLPIIGIRGIQHLANKIEKLQAKSDPRYMRLYLTHIVRMQEEIGTGGAGFRFIYASFLQEAANILDNGLLNEASEMMTDTGDSWREFALKATQFTRNKDANKDIRDVSDQLRLCAEKEAAVWKTLKAL